MSEDLQPFVLDEAADRFLVDRAIDGDARAFAVLVRRYSRVLRTYAHRILGAFGGSDDIVQEALITAWQQLATLDDRSAVRGWMIRITTRKALDYVRGAKSEDDIDGTETEAPYASGPEAAANRSSLDAALSAELAALPELQRRAWQLREYGELSYDEIATDLDLPVSTVRGLLSRARRTLMQQMAEWR